MDPTFGPLEAMRLSVMTDSPVWVILSEVRTSPGQIHQKFYSKWAKIGQSILGILEGFWGLEVAQGVVELVLNWFLWILWILWILRVLSLVPGLSEMFQVTGDPGRLGPRFETFFACYTPNHRVGLLAPDL